MIENRNRSDIDMVIHKACLVCAGFCLIGVALISPARAADDQTKSFPGLVANLPSTQTTATVASPEPAPTAPSWWRPIPTIGPQSIGKRPAQPAKRRSSPDHPTP
jgi:hypothetical protein